jgi:hypothetical protein
MNFPSTILWKEGDEPLTWEESKPAGGEEAGLRLSFFAAWRKDMPIQVTASKKARAPRRGRI